MSLLAILDEEPEIASETIEYALRSLEYNLEEYDPDGGWEEGPSYWNTTVVDLAFILNSIETALGTNYGYSNIPDILQTHVHMNLMYMQ